MAVADVRERWSDAYLDGLRSVGDDDADRAVAAYFARAAGSEPHRLFGTLVRHGELPPEEQCPEIREFLAGQPATPRWADERLVAAGQEFFGMWGLHVFNALFLAALPSTYGAARGVQVLHLTARLQTDTKRRLNETAQFHLDVMAPGALAPGGRGWRTVLRVRLMHAGVRWLIENDPLIARSDEDGPRSGTPVPGIDGPGPRWSSAWGRPVNQEDLLGTLLAFTEAVFEAFDRTGVRYSAREADAYLHTWSVIGAGLGLVPDVLPIATRSDARTGWNAIRRRQFAASPAGVAMTGALVDAARGELPRPLRGMPATSIRYFLGDATADMLGVPPPDWTARLVRPLAAVDRVLSTGKRDVVAVRRVSAWIGRRLLQGMLAAERGRERPAFDIPAHLADRWRV